MSQRKGYTLLLILALISVMSLVIGSYWWWQKQQGIHIAPPKASPIPISSCQQGLDCLLVDKNTDYGCKFTGCVPFDYSKDNWVAINADSQQNYIKNTCPDVLKMGQPACFPKPINDQFQAKCITNKCQKVPLGTADETTNWITYDRGTYQIKVPSNWRVQLPPQGQTDPPTNFGLTSWFAPDGSYLRVEYYDTGGRNLEQYLSAGQSTKKIISSKEILVDGHSGLQKQEESPTNGYTSTVTYVTSATTKYLGTDIFTITAMPYSNSRNIPPKPEVLQKYDQILSTFKFL